MSGIADVARMAGVSKSTASRALTGAGYASPETRRRVREAAEKLGYVASTNARSLSTGRTHSVGVLMPYASRWFFAEVLEGIQDALLERDLDLILYDARPGSASRRRIFDRFLGRTRFDGLLAVGLEPGDHELTRLIGLGRPVVSIVGEGVQTSVVEVDDDHAARRATEHLVALGHTAIAFLGGGGAGHWTQVDQRRLRGYRAAMQDAGLTDDIRHIHSSWAMPGGYAAAVDLLGDAPTRPTAIVAVCDEVAIGAIVAARRLGIRVPTDLSVVGIDDHEYAEMFSLTTLQQRPREQGAAAVRLLLERIDDPTLPIETVRLHTRLVMRSSTAPPRGADTAIRQDADAHGQESATSATARAATLRDGG